MRAGWRCAFMAGDTRIGAAKARCGFFMPPRAPAGRGIMDKSSNYFSFLKIGVAFAGQRA